MGTLEKEAKFERRKGYLQDALLSAVAVSGVLLVGAMAPNVLQLIGKFSGSKYRFNNQIKSVASRLAQKGLVRFEDRGGKKHLELTSEGRRVLQMEQEKNALSTRMKKRWDGRWRMVVFDIPEKYRKTRDKLRLTLRTLGFVQLQGSVWVFPHDCEEVVVLLKTELHVGGGVLYAIVEKIENDGKLKQHFHLS